MAPRSRRVPNERSADRVYGALRASILRGEYGDRVRLTEEELALRFGVSRTPIRAALAQLASDGFVEMVPRSGAMIRRRTLREISEVYEVRALLESAAAASAAVRCSDADVAALTALCEEMEERARDRDGIEILSDLNRTMHRRILDLSGNGALRDTADRLMDIGLVIHGYSSFRPPDLQRSLADHRDLVGAFAARDGQWAAAIMRAHILAARNALAGAVPRTNLPAP